MVTCIPTTRPNKYGQIEYEIEEKLGATTIYIVYVPAKRVLDTSTLHNWLDEFDREDLAELADNIYTQLMDSLEPMFLTVQIQRGGFKVNKPPLYSPSYDPACFGVK